MLRSKESKGCSEKNINSQNHEGKVVCTYCKRDNHPWQQCRLRLKAKAEREKTTKAPTDDNVIIRDEVNLSERHTKTVWMVDSGASFHMTPNAIFLSDLKTTSITKIRLGNGKLVENYLVGSLEHKTGILLNAHVVPELKYNLFSLPAATARGSQITFIVKEVKFCRGRNAAYVVCKRKHCSEASVLVFTSEDDMYKKL